MKWHMAHQYSRVGFKSYVEVNKVNLSLSYGGVVLGDWSGDTQVQCWLRFLFHIFIPVVLGDALREYCTCMTCRAIVRILPGYFGGENCISNEYGPTNLLTCSTDMGLLRHCKISEMPQLGWECPGVSYWVWQNFKKEKEERERGGGRERERERGEEREREREREREGGRERGGRDRQTERKGGGENKTKTTKKNQNTELL